MQVLDLLFTMSIPSMKVVSERNLKKKKIEKKNRKNNNNSNNKK